jgi:hypothetical protein
VRWEGEGKKELLFDMFVIGLGYEGISLKICLPVLCTF